MNRRNLMVALGATLSGGAVVGTGALSSTQATRSLSVQVASDNPGAYLGLDETDDDNGDFTKLPNGGAASNSGTNDSLVIDFNGNIANNGGSGVAVDSITELDGVFEILNQSTSDLFVNIDEVTFNTGGGTAEVRFYPGESRDANLDVEKVKINEGGSAPIGVRIDTPNTGTDNLSGAETPDATVTATDTAEGQNTIGPADEGNTGDRYVNPEP